AQTSASSSVLNRVLNDPTAIYGTLSSNGRVWLVNPAGILVGAGGRVDVAGFVASTLAIRNEDFLAGRHLFIGDGAAKDVINQGEIRTPAGGSVYLIGSNVTQSGIITTPKGETLLAAGATVSLIDSATPGVKVDITGAEGNATNLGAITAEAGRIGIAGVIVRNSGTLNASSVVSDGGRIFLRASQDAYVDGNGRIVTTGAKGGSVEVLGNRVAVMDKADIDASGTGNANAGGGQILVGGDYQGKNPDIQNASISYFGPHATLKADAADNGNGGSVIVWADDTTRAHGTISARGGANGGDGGLVETSGKRYLDVAGIKVSTAAPNGAAGNWLLDPTDITIVHSTSTGGATFPSSIFDNGGTTTATLNDFDINANLASTDITVTTSSYGGGTGDIMFDGATGGAIVITNGTASARTLTLTADNDIRFVGGTTTFNTTGAGSLGINFNPAANRKVEVQSGATVTFSDSSVTGVVAAYIGGAASGRSWENYGTVNLNGLSYIDLYVSAYSTFNNKSGGVLNINSATGWSLQSENINQDGPVNNLGTINVNGTFGGNSNYTAWEAKYNQASGGVLNIGAGKVLSMQNPDMIAGSVVLGGYGILALSERHTNPIPSFSGATLTGPGIVDIKNLGYSLTGATLGGGVALANSVGNLSVPVSGVSYSGNVGFMASGDLTVSAGVSTAGNVLLVAGWDGLSPQSLPITSNPGGDILINNATVNGAAINLYAGGDIALTATTASAAVVGSGAMLVKAGGVLSLLGSNSGGFSANLNSNAGTQTIDAGSISLTGGSGGNWSYAQINANGDQQINTTAGGISLTGGSGAYYGNFAQIVHGATGGNQTISVFGGTVALTGGSASGTTLDINLRPTVCAADPACASQLVTGAWAGITNRVGTQTLAFQNSGGVLNITGGSNGIRNAAWISQGASAAQTISGAPAVTLAGGASGGSNYKSTDGFHYLRNNASIFSPLGAQSLTLASLGLTSVATAANGFAGASIVGNGQAISMAGALSLMAGNTSYGGGAVGVRSLAGQTIGAGAVTLQAGGVGYDNTASIEQVGGAYSQSLTATSLTLQGGSGNGPGNNAGDCGVACNGLAAHNSAGVYNSGSAGQTVTVTGGAIDLIAGAVGNGNKAYIQNRAAGLQTVNAAGIFLQGGNSGGMSSFGQSNVWGGSWLSNTASITSGWSGGVIGSQNIASTGAILLAGNGGPGSSGMGGAGIAATGSQTVSGVAISLVGGAGSAYESRAGIVSLGTQSIAANSLALQAGLTGIGNRASVTGYGQTINLAGGVLTVYGGGSTSSDFSNTAEVVNFGGSGQSIILSAATTMTVRGGAGSGFNPYGGNECGAACNNLSSWNAAQVRNESGNQTINFQGGGSLLITGGSVGNDNNANIENKTTGTQSILGNPIISVARGASGGTAVWGQQQVASSKHAVGAWRWFELTNDAGISGDGTQIINASSINLDSRNLTGTAYGGTFIAGKTQTITVTGGAVRLWGGDEAINAPIGAATEFLFVAPAVIGYDEAGHSLTINADLVMLNGVAWGAYGGSPALIGTYQNATNTTINTTGGGGIVLNAATPSAALIGTLFANGGQVTLNAGSAGPITLTNSGIGTGLSGSTTLIGATVTQSTGGLVFSPALNIATSNGTVNMAGLNQASTVNLDTGTGAVNYLSGQSAVFDLSATTSGTLTITATDPVSHGNISVQKPGDMTLSGGSFTSTYGGDILVAASNNLTYSGSTFTSAYGGSYGRVGLAAGNDLTISSSLGPNGGQSAIGLAAGANVMINGGVTGRDISLIAPTINIGGSGYVLANNDLTIVAGTLSSRSLVYAGRDLTMIAGNINADGGEGFLVGHNIEATVFRDIMLDSVSMIAGNDIDLTLMGADSKLSLSNGSYLWANAPSTIHLDFTARSSGGIFVNGAETTTNDGSTGFFVGYPPTPAIPGAGLDITYANAVARDLCAISPGLCRRVDDDPNKPPPKFSRLDPGKKEGCTEGSFGCEEDEKDKKKSDEANDGKKDEKPAQKKVA
ncbi:MAG: filamentous hemagglutinin N-terminal domain-containing protein, partial [Rhodocyclaceae bacterium]|nr:filamentous hemagglutinin N-terminal domain-containing protein [Rhodocyclaceae bacterium]